MEGPLVVAGATAGGGGGKLRLSAPAPSVARGAEEGGRAGGFSRSGARGAPSRAALFIMALKLARSSPSPCGAPPAPARGGATADDTSDDGGADDGGADDGGADDAPPASLADDASTPGVRCAAVR